MHSISEKDLGEKKVRILADEAMRAAIAVALRPIDTDPVHACGDEACLAPLKDFLMQYSRTLLASHRQGWCEDRHALCIEMMIEKMSSQRELRDMLVGGAISLGRAQLLVNYFCRQMWMCGVFLEPTHFPITDESLALLAKANAQHSTLPNSIFSDDFTRKEYQSVIDAANVLAKQGGMSIATWDIQQWSIVLESEDMERIRRTMAHQRERSRL